MGSSGLPGKYSRSTVAATAQQRGIAREKSARRYRDWPGAQQAFGVTFMVEDRFVRSLDDDRLDLALHRSSSSEKFDELLEFFDTKIQGFLAMCGRTASSSACRTSSRI